MCLFFIYKRLEGTERTTRRKSALIIQLQVMVFNRKDMKTIGWHTAERRWKGEEGEFSLAQRELPEWEAS